MDFNELFSLDIQPDEDVEMDKDEYLTKSTQIFSIVDTEYSKAWVKVRLNDGEYPDESICDKCEGCGSIIVNGEEVECIANREEGECYRIVFDSEQFGNSMAQIVDDIWDLLSINKLK
jgi:hypothetical protein